MPQAPNEQYHANSQHVLCQKRGSIREVHGESRGDCSDRHRDPSSLLVLRSSRPLRRCNSVSSSSKGQEQEIQRLRSKVASLDETSQLESVVREKTAQIAALVGGLEVMQATNVVHDESVMKASTNHALLEKQIERLGNDLEDQVKKGESLEARATKAEKSLLELGRNLERCIGSANTMHKFTEQKSAS